MIQTETMPQPTRSPYQAPPLTNPSRAKKPDQNNLTFRKWNHQRSLSSFNSKRAQQIAEGKRELMEMVNNMPEACYELSLKDIVEIPIVKDHQEEDQSNRNLSREVLYRSESRKKKEENSKGVLVRRNSRRIVNNNVRGFYLKMVVPVPLGSPKMKKKNESGLNNSTAKVSPKPSSMADGSVKSTVDKDQWGNESGRSSFNGRSKNRHAGGGFWSCFPRIRSKSRR